MTKANQRRKLSSTLPSVAKHHECMWMTSFPETSTTRMRLTTAPVGQMPAAVPSDKTHECSNIAYDASVTTPA